MTNFTLIQTLHGHTDQVNALGIVNVDGGRLVSGALDGHVLVWDLANSTIDIDLIAIDSGPVNVVLSFGLRSIVVLGNSNTIYFWDLYPDTNGTVISRANLTIDMGPANKFTRGAIIYQNTYLFVATSRGGVEFQSVEELTYGFFLSDWDQDHLINCFEQQSLFKQRF